MPLYGAMPKTNFLITVRGSIDSIDVVHSAADELTKALQAVGAVIDPSATVTTSRAMVERPMNERPSGAVRPVTTPEERRAARVAERRSRQEAPANPEIEARPVPKNMGRPTDSVPAPEKKDDPK